MNTLIYLTNQSNNLALDSNKIFFQEFRKRNGGNLIVTVESDFDYQYFKNRKQLLGIQKIINLYNNDSKNLEFKNTSEFSIDYLLKIEPAKFNNEKKLINFLGYFENTLQKILDDYKIQNFCYLSLSGVFRSLGLFHSYHLIKKLPIKIFFPFTTPVKGRFMIYQDIYFKSETFDSLINEVIKNENKPYKKILDEYFNDYKKFKSSHLKYIKNRKSISSTKSEKNFSLKFFFKKIINRIQYGPKRKNLTTSLNKPYAVILLSKNNQWYNSYADQDLLNIPELIKSVHSNLPSNYSLALKGHPHMVGDDILERVSSNLNDCSIYFDELSTEDLIKSSEIVFSFGTTAGVESLMYFKKVIEIGKNPAYYNISNPPVFRAKKISDIKDVINICINNSINENEVYSYFDSLLKSSFSISPNDKIALEKTDYSYRQIARELNTKITEISNLTK